MNTIHRAKLAEDPFIENERVRIDCYLLNQDGTPAEPQALIQLVSGRTRRTSPPSWKRGDVIEMLPVAGFGWNDVYGTNRCSVNLSFNVTCQEKGDCLFGVLPINPNYPSSLAEEPSQ